MRSTTLAAGSVAGVAAAAALLGTAGPAAADPVVTGGSTTISVTLPAAAGAVRAGIGARLGVPAAATYNSTTQRIDTTFPVTGGTADVSTFTGTVQHAGSVTLTNCHTHRSVTLSNLSLDFATNVISATVSGSSTPQPVLDLAGDGTSSVNGQTQTYRTSEVDVDAVGAALLDKKLGTSYFTGGQNIGSFATTYTTG